MTCQRTMNEEEVEEEEEEKEEKKKENGNVTKKVFGSKRETFSVIVKQNFPSLFTFQGVGSFLLLYLHFYSNLFVFLSFFFFSFFLLFFLLSFFFLSFSILFPFHVFKI